MACLARPAGLGGRCPIEIGTFGLTAAVFGMTVIASGGEVRSGVERTSWAFGALALAMVAGVGFADYRTGWAVTFSVVYLLPVFVAVWMVGRRMGIVVTVLAAAISATVLLKTCPVRATALWNSGINSGIYLAFFILLDQLR